MVNVYRITDKKEIRRIHESDIYDNENNIVLRFIFSDVFKGKNDIILFHYLNGDNEISVSNISNSLTKYKDVWYVEKSCPTAFFSEQEKARCWLQFVNSNTEQSIQTQSLYLSISDMPEEDGLIPEKDLEILTQLSIDFKNLETDLTNVLVIEEGENNAK